MFLQKTFVAVSASVVLALALAACGDDKDDDKKPAAAPAPTATATTAPTTAAVLPASYSNCAGCHGADGEGGSYPALKDTELTKAEFVEIVKTGKGIMGANLVPEAQAEAIWEYFRKK